MANPIETALEPRAAWLVREYETFLRSALKSTEGEFAYDQVAIPGIVTFIALQEKLEAWQKSGFPTGVAQLPFEHAFAKAIEAYRGLYDAGLVPDELSPHLQNFVPGESTVPVAAVAANPTPTPSGTMVAGPDPETVAPASVIDAPIIPSAPGILSAEEPLATTSSSQVDAAGQVRAHIVTSDQALCPVLAPADVLALPVHPAASHFPLLTGKRLDALVRDIKQRGVIDPVTVVRDDGQWFLLDGRNRREAAKILGITSLPFDVYPGTAPAEFVRSKNLRRRHLSLAERLAAAKALVAQVKQAKVARKVAAAGGNVATSDVTRGKTRDQLAADLGISARTAQDLLTVEAKATPELQQAVDDGVTPHVAAQVASLPPDQQRQAVNDARSKAGGSAKGLTRALGAAVKAVKKGGAPAGKRGSKASSGAAAAGSPKAAFGALQAEVGATPPAAIPVAWELVSTMKSTEGGACTGEGTIGGVALEFRFDMATRRLHVRPSSSRTEPHGG